MPVGHSNQCRACRSTRRPEIDRRLLAGDSTRAVSSWLAGVGETISHVSLANHKLAHLAVVEEARAQIEAARPAFDAAVTKVVADVSLLDEIAGMAIAAARAFPQPPADMPGAVVFTASLREARMAVVAKHELLYGKKYNLEGTVDPDELFARLAAQTAGRGGVADAGGAGGADPGGAEPDRPGDRTR